MKEKLDERKRTVERDSVFQKTAEAKKDQKRKLNFSTFFEKKKSFQKEQNDVLPECKDYLKKNIFKR